jgi:hypothetical protein
MTTALACTRLGWFSRYKWRLDEYHIQTVPIYGVTAKTKDGWLLLRPNGTLGFNRGYCWDGASGPTWDTVSSRLPSLVHDGLYQLIREGLIDSAYKDVSDMELERLLIKEGMHPWRARVWYLGVKYFGWISL